MGRNCDYLEGFADSDSVGENKSSKSTSGGIISFGGHCITSCSSTQQVIARSSAAAELYAMTKTTAQLICMISMARDFEINWNGLVHTDSAAALGIIRRRGLGTTRHINVQYLWIQEKINNKEMKAFKVGTLDNPADILTKPVTKESIDQHVKNMGLRLTDGIRTKDSRLLPWLKQATVIVGLAAMQMSVCSICSKILPIQGWNFRYKHMQISFDLLTDTF